MVAALPAPPDPWRPDRAAGARPSGLRALRGLGRLGQGRRNQAPRRPDRPAARPRSAVRRADVRREAPPFPVAVLARAAGLGRDVDPRPFLVRARPRRAGRGVCRARRVDARVRRDQLVRAVPRGGGDDPDQVLDARLRGRAAEALREPREEPAEGVEADRRGLAQPGQAAGVRGGAGGHVRPDRPALRSVGRDRRRVEALRPRKRHRDGDLADRGGNATGRESTSPTRSRERESGARTACERR